MYVMRVIYVARMTPKGVRSARLTHTQTGRATLDLKCKGSLERGIESQGQFSLSYHRSYRVILHFTQNEHVMFCLFKRYSSP